MEFNNLVDEIGERYGTYDPFIIADKLNIDVRWADIYPRPYGDTMYYGDEPVVMLSNAIRDSPERYYVLGHELGHVIIHKGLTAYYIAKAKWRSRSENEANKFAISLIAHLYVEENGKLPDSYKELEYMYGFPDIYGYEEI
ncbi:ImmA/IrrE family metallo-endopeptidase [Paucilactobacillus kaifaensis]|uniref:ImmA/IrrE family metallo-endopeptidase n=1 Tax=Paucilactobacillus kaifaensis TaxID=2559921 RepID=UPI0010F80152|nr:ImmA/IrrE family metallo-endopeptidase [Paucilactobacillus kaifaensis]